MLNRKKVLTLMGTIGVVVACLGVAWLSMGFESGEKVYTLDSVPEFSGDPYVEINGGLAEFTVEEIDEFIEFEEAAYTELDELGRCGSAFMVVQKSNPYRSHKNRIKGSKFSIIKPSGWQEAKHNNTPLYREIYLLPRNLSGTRDSRNIITGTKYLYKEGILQFEKEILDYVNNTNNSVAYRVTPVFEEDNLLASGVHLEAYSVEDSGEGVNFNIYCYNVQPGVEIDYSTGNSNSELAEE